MKQFLLSFILPLSCLTASAEVGDIFDYTYEGQTLTYSCIDETRMTCRLVYGKDASGAVIIPSVAKNGRYSYEVTEIGESVFSGCTGLTSVTIPNSVTNIGSLAFYECEGLTEVNINDIAAWCNINFGGWSANPLYHAQNLYVNGEKVTNLVIPDGVTNIGSWAFYGCTGLTEVTIPNSVTNIGEYAFKGCRGLTAVNINDIAAWYNIRLGGSANPLFYAHNLYVNGEKVTNIVIPDSVTDIGDYIFEGCTGLTEITIPNSVTNIGSYAFRRCTGLTEVTIPNSVTNIGRYAFEGCTGLTEITIPNSVTNIGSHAFRRCTGLTEVTIPNSVTNIGEYAFENCEGLTEVNINDIAAWYNINFGGWSANPLFYAHNLYVNGEKVTNIVFPDSVTNIGDYVFNGCTGLTKVTIPNSVTNIGSSAFYGCTGLTEITIPNSVTNIGSSAFYGCTGLTEITIPNSVTNIGSSAFYGCTGLTEITIPNSVTNIDWSAFYGCIGLTAVNINDIAAWCNINLGEEHANPLFYAHNLYVNGKKVTNLVIPDSVTNIGHYVFYGCIGLTEVTIPNTVTYIGYCAFYGCTGLTTVYSLNTTPPSTEEGCFNNIYNTATLLVPQESVETYRTADTWKNFINIQGIDVTGIKGVELGKWQKPNAYYDLSGRRLNTPKHGINIINGKKAIVK